MTATFQRTSGTLGGFSRRPRKFEKALMLTLKSMPLCSTGLPQGAGGAPGNHPFLNAEFPERFIPVSNGRSWARPHIRSGGDGKICAVAFCVDGGAARIVPA